MSDPTYIIGHKNPDADAVCSAIAYAAFKDAIGLPGYLPARCGNSNARIDAILGRFGVPLPMFLGDVTPRAQDIMRRDILSVKDTGTCSEALELLDTHGLRMLPVVNGEGRLAGQVSIFDLGDYFIPRASSPKKLRHVNASVADIVAAVNGTPFTGCDDNTIAELYVRVGAMDVNTFDKTPTARGIPPAQTIIVVGDRADVQRRAIEMGVRMIVITGGLSVTPEILDFARERGVAMAGCAMDSASTAWVIRAAARIAPMIAKVGFTFSPAEKLASIRRRLAAAPDLVNCVVDEDERLLGVFTKADLLKPGRTRLVLVDHNELTQAVDGAGEVDIVEVVDHHRLGNPPTQSPILFVNRPVGSTCSIIADFHRMHGLRPSPAIAGVMMSGLIADTLLLRSPTATPLDGELLDWLSGIAGVKPAELAEVIFNAGSVLLSGTPSGAVRSDCKRYEESGRAFSVSQIEELGFDVFMEKSDALLEALESYRSENDLYFASMLVTDINTQNSLLLVKGSEEFLDAITYPMRSPEIFDLPGIVSRKKQLIPYLSGLLAPKAG